MGTEKVTVPVGNCVGIGGLGDMFVFGDEKVNKRWSRIMNGFPANELESMEVYVRGGDEVNGADMGAKCSGGELLRPMLLIRRCHSASLAPMAMLLSRKRCISHSSELMLPRLRMLACNCGVVRLGRSGGSEEGGISCV